MNHNPMCDSSRCLSATGEVRLLPYGFDKDGNATGNLIVCKACYNYEMAYRRAEHANSMPRPEWESLEIYTGA